MRKIVLFIAALLFMTVPVMAASTVTIGCTQGTGADINAVIVSYGSNLNLIRAFGLDITVVGANITKVVPIDPNYRIYPGQITIAADGNVTDYGTCYDPCDLGDANVTIEMGSLYTTDSNYSGDPNAGFNKKPTQNGTLLKFYVSGGCTYAVTKNVARGGVVMENPAEDPTVATPLCSGSVVVVCTVPNVVNDTNAVAQGKITGAGFVVGTITTAYHNTIVAGNVISTTPAAGATPGCNTAVAMLVSKGPCFYAGMVDKCGRTITAAMVTTWTNLGYPACWCYACHCRGDTNNDNKIKTADTTVWSAAWAGVYNACADINYDGKIKTSDSSGGSAPLTDGWNRGWSLGCN
jgi:hypothetical protein